MHCKPSPMRWPWRSGAHARRRPEEGDDQATGPPVSEREQRWLESKQANGLSQTKRGTGPTLPRLDWKWTAEIDLADQGSKRHKRSGALKRDPTVKTHEPL